MNPLHLSRIEGREWRVLCLGAHSDDIEIGCGGTLLKILHERSGTRVRWVVLSASSAERRAEALQSAAGFVPLSDSREASVETFLDSRFPQQIGEIKDYFERLRETIDPDIVFTHFRGDAHQDHRLVNELTWNTFRDHLVLEYEVPKYDGDMGRTNLYVPLERDFYERKLEILLAAFPSQSTRSWYSADTFMALMRLRGIECNADSGHAEGFYCHKLVLD